MRVERITRAYWDVSHARNHPDGKGLTVQDALGQLNASDRLRPEEWRLKELTHTLRFDIIEGNDKWREKQQGTGSVLTLRTT